MVISVNRSIVRALSNELKKVYVYESVCASNDDEKLSYEEEVIVSDTILEIIKANENFNEMYGVLQPNGIKQVTEECLIPGSSEPSGFRQNGKILIAPFDWSWDENGDFDYSFNIFYAIEHISLRN